MKNHTTKWILNFHPLSVSILYQNFNEIKRAFFYKCPFKLQQPYLNYYFLVEVDLFPADCICFNTSSAPFTLAFTASFTKFIPSVCFPVKK